MPSSRANCSRMLFPLPWWFTRQSVWRGGDCGEGDIGTAKTWRTKESSMAKQIRFKGNPVHLEGTELELGSKAPKFKVVSQDLEDVSLADFKGKVKVITSFPSLDTPVCDLQVKEFNKRASGFSPEVVVLGISKDLPFAQKRFCEMNGIKNVEVLSDYKYSSFGNNYGLLIKELNLLARAVLILDQNDIVRYIQIVEELTTPPDYEDALKNLQQILKNED